MATIKKTANGRWHAQVFSHTENGKRKYISFTGDTKQEVQLRVAEFQLNKKNESRPQNLTVEKAIEHYIESKCNILSPKTYKTYVSYRDYYKPVANIKIGNLSSQDLQLFINDLSKNVSPKTVSNIYSLLKSSIIQYCDRSFHVTMPKKKPVTYQVPTDADVNNLIQNANPRLKLAIILGSQGMRRGEIASLKYSDVLYDFNALYIHSDIVQGVDGWVYKDTAKTDGSERRLIVPKEVIEMIGHGDPDAYILGILPSTITADFINLRKKLGLQCRFHDLRHYMASILHAIGVPDSYIMERGGWKNDSVLKSVYRNTLADKSIHYTSVANDYFKKNILEKQQEADAQ